MVQRSPESPHQSRIEIVVVFVSSSINDVEITKDEPFSSRMWLKAPQMLQERLFFAVALHGP